MAYSEDSQDRARMEESRKVAITALENATKLVSAQGAGFERHARIAEIAASLYAADARRQAKG